MTRAKRRRVDATWWQGVMTAYAPLEQVPLMFVSSTQEAHCVHHGVLMLFKVVNRCNCYHVPVCSSCTIYIYTNTMWNGIPLFTWLSP